GKETCDALDIDIDQHSPWTVEDAKCMFIKETTNFERATTKGEAIEKVAAEASRAIALDDDMLENEFVIEEESLPSSSS
ncbi:hypothetical protein KI387_038434, partial [Taxus chinensis]